MPQLYRHIRLFRTKESYMSVQLPEKCVKESYMSVQLGQQKFLLATYGLQKNDIWTIQNRLAHYLSNSIQADFYLGEIM